jgi:hypothetical protein
MLLRAEVEHAGATLVFLTYDDGRIVAIAGIPTRGAAHQR